jgi:hypothetical protein
MIDVLSRIIRLSFVAANRRAQTCSQCDGRTPHWMCHVPWFEPSTKGSRISLPSKHCIPLAFLGEEYLGVAVAASETDNLSCGRIGYGLSMGTEQPHTLGGGHGSAPFHQSDRNRVRKMAIAAARDVKVI